MKKTVLLIACATFLAYATTASAETAVMPIYPVAYGVMTPLYGPGSLGYMKSLAREGDEKNDTRPSRASAAGMAHKVFGYTTAIAATAAMVTGFVIPEHKAHTATTYSTAGLAGLATMTGYIAYYDVITFKGGLTTQNSHVLLGTLSTAGLITSAIIGGLKVKHCAPGIVSGAVLYASVIVVHF